MPGIRLSKIKKRSIQLNLNVDLLDALREMGLAAHEPCDLKGMIECSLMWAVWAHNRGRGPDTEIGRLAEGYLQARRERREVEYLDKLYRLSGGAR
jgi:hypothetical protein